MLSDSIVRLSGFSVKPLRSICHLCLTGVCGAACTHSPEPSQSKWVMRSFLTWETHIRHTTVEMPCILHSNRTRNRMELCIPLERLRQGNIVMHCVLRSNNYALLVTATIV